MGAKAGYSGALYTRLQEPLYLWYGSIGSVRYVPSIICTVMVVVMAWRDHIGRGAAAGSRLRSRPWRYSYPSCCQ
jgi:hypothetical protein